MSRVMLAVFILIGFLFHFYNLNWGAPFFFHPDERNIASSVSQLHFPEQMHPHFFAYGSLPIYVLYFTGVCHNILFSALPTAFSVSFEQAILISRIYSALFATLCIPLLFLIGKKMKESTTGSIAAFLATTSVGFIQFAHFGTFEMWLTFFGLLLFWLCLDKITKKTLILSGVVLGILIATKVSSIVLLALVGIRLLIDCLRKGSTSLKKTSLIFIGNSCILGLVTLLISVVTNPYVLIDQPAFRGSMQYESSVVLGTLNVFYTGEFFDTTPIIYQLSTIYPFLLNPVVMILFLVSFGYILFVSCKRKNYPYALLTSFFLLLFLSQAFFFAKWTRYMVPTLPFIYLMIALTATDLLKNTQRKSHSLTIYQHIGTLLCGLICLLFALSYTISTFGETDTRIAARDAALILIPPEAHILSEVYDLGILPFNEHYKKITLFNFYDLDNHSPDVTEKSLQQQLLDTDYFIVLSQRLMKSRKLNNHHYPQGATMYQSLQNGSLGFQKIYETPCDLWCTIAYLGDPLYRFEGTATVFDRPTLIIYKKQ